MGYSLDALIGREGLEAGLRSELREIRLRMIDLNNSFRDEIFLLRQMSFADLKAELSLLFEASAISISLPQLKLNVETEDALARTLLEIARNSARHSETQTLKIEHFIIEGKLVIEASDEGQRKISHRERSFGLASINERIERIGAQVILQSGSGGNRYRIELDLS